MYQSNKTLVSKLKGCIDTDAKKYRQFTRSSFKRKDSASSWETLNSTTEGYSSLGLIAHKYSVDIKKLYCFGMHKIIFFQKILTTPS